MSKSDRLGRTTAALVLAALALFAAAFVFETRMFRSALLSRSARELNARVQLAAANLGEALETGDFRKVHESGAKAEGEGERLTVFSGGSGLVYDSHAYGRAEEDYLYDEAKAGTFRVRLGLPRRQVLAPCRAANWGFVLSALVGAAAVCLLFLVLFRQRVRIRELTRLEQFRRDFIADVSHEIKTPLTGILGAVDMLSDGYDPRLVEMIGKESVRLNSLAQDILSLARLERTDGAPERTAVDAGDLLEETAERFRDKAAAAGMEVVCREEAKGTVICDAALVSQALANLVENAIRHSRGTKVSLACSVTERAATFTVEDDGIGISAEDAKRVFERFYRVDPSRTASTGGAGLGLAIVRQIALMHGGDVTLGRSASGGCRFALTLNLD